MISTLPFEVSQHSVLIVAPHPDDEVFGCGGLIALKNNIGVKVYLLMLTEGEGSHIGCCDTSEFYISKQRHQLTIKANKVLGLEQEHIFWIGLPDGEIPIEGNSGFVNAKEKIIYLLNKLKPDEIFAPAYFDCWPDHESAARLVESAINSSTQSSELYFYPIWMWHNLRFIDIGKLSGWHTCTLDIGSVISKKVMAISCYMSSINQKCGNPICGNLPIGFINYFQKSNEIFFKRNVVNDD
jgi:LmbE family N-acetylglucosaminyl deacetylase